MNYLKLDYESRYMYNCMFGYDHKVVILYMYVV